MESKIATFDDLSHDPDKEAAGFVGFQNGGTS